MRRKRKKQRLFRRLILYIGSLIIASICLLFGFIYILGPPPLKEEPKVVFFDQSDQFIQDQTNTNEKTFVALDEISPHVIDATIAIEDRNFYDHFGFDIKRIGGAILKDIANRSLKEGASTLSQQYARNLYLSHEKTWNRKLKEAFYTMRLEMHYPKERILTGYLNTIYYGHGAYGIEAASQLYFHKRAKDLTLAEAAMLSGIPKGPTYYSPLNDLNRAKERQELILKTMKQTGKINDIAYKEALEEQLDFTKEVTTKTVQSAGYFQDAALKEAKQLIGRDLSTIEAEQLNIYTTLDVEKQQILESTIADTIDEQSAIEVGAIAMNPLTGAIDALVGGRSYQASSFNRALEAKRMPGSTFKPLLYYQALENGFQPNTMLQSEATSFEWGDDKVYEPSNFNDAYANEPITLAQAIALSDNIYAVKTHLFLEREQLTWIAKKLGITSPLHSYPSLALGTAEVRLQEMVNSYSIFANGGRHVEGTTIRKITDDAGTVLYENTDQKQKQLLDQQKAFMLTSMMQGMFQPQYDRHSSVTGRTIAEDLTNDYAGKSGSTDSDNWMIGYSPTIVTGVWTGYDDNRTIETSQEMGYAKRIWAQFMEETHTQMSEAEKTFQVPAGLIAVEVDLETGQKASPYCAHTATMYFKKQDLPEDVCTVHLHGDQIPFEFDETEELNKLHDQKQDVQQLEEEFERLNKKQFDFFDQWRDWLTG